MRPSITAFALLACVAPGGLAAQQFMDVRQATARAVTLLRGDPYGATNADVAKHIRASSLVTKGSTSCGRVKRPVWSFAVKVDSKDNPIDGVLDVDAVSGTIACATLPFLD